MSKKIRFLTEYAIHYFRKYILAIILGSIFGSFIFSQRDNLNRIYHLLQVNKIDIGIEGLYTINTLPLTITDKLSYGFTTITENDKAAVSPIIKDLTIRNENLTYNFIFNRDLVWHNGNKFDTSDITVDISRVELKPVAPEEINLILKETFSPLLSKLNKPLFIKKTLIGLGPFKVDSIEYKDGYIKTLSISSVDPDTRQKINYRFYPNTEDLIYAYKLGEVDQISIGVIKDELTNWPNTDISQQIVTDKYLAIFLNTEKLNDKQLRQAIAYATPKSNNKNDRCLGPISPNSWAYNPQIKEYNFNSTRAKELFEGNKIDQLNLTVFDRNLLKTAETIKTAWEQTLKVKVNIKIENTQRFSQGNYDAILAHGSIPSDPDQYSFWHSTQSKTNITKLSNSRIDKLLEEGRQIHDQAERKRIYSDFQKFLLEETPAIFLNFPTTYTISRVK